MTIDAICLTFDAQIGFAELVVKSYRRLWPNHPFRFLIPFNDVAAPSDFLREAPDCRLLHTPRDIRSTMEILLNGKGDNDWVFWCIDDRYPVTAPGTDALDRIAADLQSLGGGDARGVRCLPWREELQTEQREIGGEPMRFAAPQTVWGFYMHHFVRASVLRETFLTTALPATYGIRDLHDYWLAQGAFPGAARTLVPARTLLSFAEPCKRGQLLKGAAAVLRANGCPVPNYSEAES